ncbi:hypothetical protein Glove_48g71 [Diversispora epigaea]|uniref:Uncharacterized protein n=1 Tax=Diversispora epigaea TaxID=1348612 RepID=A0A397JE47_9GLOM|nr:hypothetical protein Glove_48g71 [Diversispora epigaea]
MEVEVEVKVVIKEISDGQNDSKKSAKRWTKAFQSYITQFRQRKCNLGLYKEKAFQWYLKSAER